MIKTLERINLFYKKFNKKDGIESINGEAMPTLSNLLNSIDWKDLTNGLPGRFHGDFHFENILYCSKKKTFKFLDWRQDFGGDLEVGDIYYDLAKLLHGLIVSA
jgi:aminoglycoside phosphotransferase family enzyme